MRRLRHLFFILFVLAVFASCQKDEAINDVSPSALKADSVNSLSAVSKPGNVLAVAGTLKITIKDSTYTFDAARDSIAFVNVYLDDKKYFGITAINKAHTMSFGISSAGYAAANLAGDIAGSQLLFNNTGNPNVQYTLSQHIGAANPGKLNLIQYQRDSVLARGTFTTYLATDAKPNSAFYKAVGSFELKRK
jgi:hypothetical protein